MPSRVRGRTIVAPPNTTLPNICPHSRPLHRACSARFLRARLARLLGAAAVEPPSPFSRPPAPQSGIAVALSDSVLGVYLSACAGARGHAIGSPGVQPKPFCQRCTPRLLKSSATKAASSSSCQARRWPNARPHARPRTLTRTPKSQGRARRAVGDAAVVAAVAMLATRSIEWRCRALSKDAPA